MVLNVNGRSLHMQTNDIKVVYLLLFKCMILLEVYSVTLQVGASNNIV